MAKPLRALILEDSADDLALAVRELGLGGFDVTYENYQTAADLKAALERGPWDVILSDYSMPGFKAPSALEMLHESGLDIPFIIVSGAIGDESAAMIMKAGAHDYVNKGNLSRLVPAIERELREVGTRRAQREFEQALRESEARFRTLYSGITDAILIHRIAGDSLPGRVIEANDHACRMLGYGRDELLARSITDLHRDLPAGNARSVVERLRQGRDALFEREMRRKDGSSLPVEIHAQMFSYLGANAVLSIIRDVTERKRAEEQLRRAHEQSELAQTAGGTGIWDWNVLTGQIEWSRQMFRLFGLDPQRDTASFESWGRALHPDDKVAAGAVIDRALKEHTRLVNEYRVVLPDGRTRWIAALGEGTYDAEGRPVRMAGVCLDVTERKRAEEENARQLDELRRWQAVMLDREDRNMELKREVNRLLRRLGEPIRYPSQEEAGGE